MPIQEITPRADDDHAVDHGALTKEPAGRSVVAEAISDQLGPIGHALRKRRRKLGDILAAGAELR
jgi:hypothetical protein